MNIPISYVAKDKVYLTLLFSLVFHVLSTSQNSGRVMRGVHMIAITPDPLELNPEDYELDNAEKISIIIAILLGFFLFCIAGGLYFDT